MAYKDAFVNGARIISYNHKEGAGRLVWSGIYFDFTRDMIRGNNEAIMAGLVVNIKISKLELLAVISPESNEYAS